MARSNNTIALFIATASVSALAFAPSASAQDEAPRTNYSCTAATASHFSHFGLAINRPSIACDVTHQVNDRLSLVGWARLAPNEDWSGLHQVGSEADALAKLLAEDNEYFQVTLTGGAYFMYADGLDATIGTAKVALDTKPIFDVLTFHAEYAEFVGGFVDSKPEVSGTARFPIEDGRTVDFTLGASRLLEAKDNIVFGELGLSGESGRVWLEGFQGKNDRGVRLAFTWSWQGD